MKRIILSVALCFVVASVNAMPTAKYYGGSHRPHYHYHHSIARANDRANTALFVAFGAVIIATVGLVKASEYNQGQVQIARF